MFVYMTPCVWDKGPGTDRSLLLWRCSSPPQHASNSKPIVKRGFCLRIFASVNISSRLETIGALFQLEGEISTSMVHLSWFASLMTLD